MLTPAQIRNSLAALGYSYSRTQPNLIGIRTALNVPNVFNDLLVAVFTQPAQPKGLNLSDRQLFLNAFGYVGKNGLPLKVDGLAGTNTDYAQAAYEASVGTERLKAWPMTTDPGAYYLEHPLAGGCAVLKPGQYKGAYILGFHQSKPDHPALVQHGGPVTIYRDNDRDNLAEETSSQENGYFGINIHRSQKEGATPVIANWSAGCQVFQRRDHHAQLLALCEQYRATSGNKFTYTLLRERELIRA
ncbi:MAG: hypothetical protein JWP57_4248 [Spirosoma sp.]|nr:hypothetical protein [Spirosoma sp.]